MAHSLPFLALRVQGLSKANNAVAFAGALAGKKGSPQRHRVRRAETSGRCGKSWRQTMMWQGSSLHSVRKRKSDSSHLQAELFATAKREEKVGLLLSVP